MLRGTAVFKAEYVLPAAHPGPGFGLQPEEASGVRWSPMTSRRVVLINVALFVAGAVVLLSQNSVQDYLLSRSPHERLMRHFAEFEKKARKAPDIRRALEGMNGSDSEKLQELSRRGTARLDDTALLERARIMSALFSQLSDRACANSLRGASAATENDKAEFEAALLRLEADFVSKWMACLYKSIVAEARATPMRTVTHGEVAAAFGALEQKIGRDASMRVDAGLNLRASDTELAWALRTVYAVAPTLPEPHGAALLRMLAQGGEEPDATSIPPLLPEVR